MRICVYGSSSNEIDKSYITATEELGAALARAGHGVVYGGGAQGVMGAAARGVRAENGEVTGVAPDFFNVDGVLFEDCTDFIYTKTMRERKQIMEDLSDAFIVCPGGIGTFEEFFEILTLKQLARHKKAIVVFDVNGYFDPMIAMLEHTVRQGFMKEACLELYDVVHTAEEAIACIEKYVPREVRLKDVRYVEEGE